MSEIVLDRKTFGALAEETRIKILKALRERPKMQSELANEQNLAVSTIAEHMEKLEAAGLVRAKRGEHKWVYFALTQKGEQVVSPEKHTGVFVFALSVSLLMIAGALVMMMLQQTSVAAGTAYDNQKTENNVPMTAGAPTLNESQELGGGSQNTAVTAFNLSPYILVAGILVLCATLSFWFKIRRMQKQ